MAPYLIWIAVYGALVYVALLIFCDMVG